MVDKYTAWLSLMVSFLVVCATLEREVVVFPLPLSLDWVQVGFDTSLLWRDEETVLGLACRRLAASNSCIFKMSNYMKCLTVLKPSDGRSHHMERLHGEREMASVRGVILHSISMCLLTFFFVLGCLFKDVCFQGGMYNKHSQKIEIRSSAWSNDRDVFPNRQ
jgi:hypothetical protein